MNGSSIRLSNREVFVVSQLEDFENSVLEAVADVLTAKAEMLAAVALTPKVNPLERGREGRSELTIDFLDASGIADVIEFFVVDDGRPVAPLEEIEAWLRDTLDDVIGRRGSTRTNR